MDFPPYEVSSSDNHADWGHIDEFHLHSSSFLSCFLISCFIQHPQLGLDPIVLLVEDREGGGSKLGVAVLEALLRSVVQPKLRTRRGVLIAEGTCHALPER